VTFHDYYQCLARLEWELIAWRGLALATYHSGNPHEVHIWLRHYVEAFGVVIVVALRVSNTGRVEGYAIKGTVTMEAVINFVRRSGLQNLRVRLVKSGHWA
jgi:hypothetical protein